MICLIFGSSLAQPVTSFFFPICMSETPPYWNNSSLSFVPEITDNYIHWKSNILMDNLAKVNVQLWRSWNLLLQKIFTLGRVNFFVFLSQNYIIWK